MNEDKPIIFLGKPLEDQHVPIRKDPNILTLEDRHATCGKSPDFEVDAANLEGPPDEGERRVELRCELRTGTKVQISLHRPDPDGPVLAQLCGSPIPSNLTIRELRAIALLFDEASESGGEL